MCIGAVTCAVNFSLTLADAPSILKSLTLAVTVFSVKRHFFECADRVLAKKFTEFWSNIRKNFVVLCTSLKSQNTLEFVSTKLSDTLFI